ncbi:MAG: hypothetical protein RIB57_16415 [Pelagibacterium sp.]|uniref:hypothetical protein n=1 Tax=Pelagibacterium sp. TaxID=1967288 RepID=UPI0032EFE1C4
MKIDDAVNVIVAFIRNVQLNRAIYAVDDKPAINFWIILHSNCLDTATIEWCKLFGKSSGTVHWERFVPATERAEFEKGLLAAINKSEDEWSNYRNSLLKYRDTSVAHLDALLKRSTHFPDFTIGIEAAYFYYDWLSANASRIDLPNVRAYSADFRVEAEHIAEQAIAATRGMNELDLSRYFL